MVENQMKESLNKKDIIGGYLSRFMSLCSGIITLPLILRTLSEDEIAFNYILISLMSIVALFDLGFAPQFSRNFAFIFGGSQELVRIGLPLKSSNKINFQLLYQLIESAKLLYLGLSIAVAIILCTFGTLYVYDFTDKFTLINNAGYLWLLFSISVILDFYYRFYTPMLFGSGQIASANIIEILATSIKIVVLIVLLLIGFGLWGVVLSNFIRIIIVRILSYKIFYTRQMKASLNKFYGLRFSRIDILKILWPNAKRALVVSVATYVSTQLITILAGAYLSKSDVASYGLLVQLVGVITALSMSISNSMNPIYSILRVQNNRLKIMENFYFSLGTFLGIYFIGIIFLIYTVPSLLIIIKSNAVLPSMKIMFIYLIYKFLENQHCICSSYLTTKNKIIDFESATIVGVCNLIVQWGVISHIDCGLMGLVIIQAIIPLFYPNWKWPYEVCKEFGVKYRILIVNSCITCFSKMKRDIHF